MNTTHSSTKKPLAILAAGIGSRYSGAIKQISELGPNGETILDYSIYDALQAGFNEIILIIRKHIEEDVKKHFLPRWENKVSVRFAYQELDSFTGGFSRPNERVKPWGTAHALLCAREVIDAPFVIINADDFYGREAFVLSSQQLDVVGSQEAYGLVAYRLGETISEHGSVNRGVCTIGEDHHLRHIKECVGIGVKNGAIGYSENGVWTALDADAPVSMNFFYFSPHIFDFAEKEFNHFLHTEGNQLSSEYFIPKLVDVMMNKYGKTVSTLRSKSLWFGVTYREDDAPVQSRLAELIRLGIYPAQL